MNRVTVEYGFHIERFGTTVAMPLHAAEVLLRQWDEGEAEIVQRTVTVTEWQPWVAAAPCPCCGRPLGSSDHRAEADRQACRPCLNAEIMLHARGAACHPAESVGGTSKTPTE